MRLQLHAGPRHRGRPDPAPRPLAALARPYPDGRRKRRRGAAARRARGAVRRRRDRRLHRRRHQSRRFVPPRRSRTSASSRAMRCIRYGAGGPNASFAFLTAYYMRTYGARAARTSASCAWRSATMRCSFPVRSVQEAADARGVSHRAPDRRSASPVRLRHAVRRRRRLPGDARGPAQSARPSVSRASSARSSATTPSPTIRSSCAAAGRSTATISTRRRACAPKDIDFVQTYDDYPVIIAACSSRISASAAKGEGAGVRAPPQPHARRRRSRSTRRGGQLSVGQAGAAGGFLGMVEAIRQLTGQAAGRQVRDAKTGPRERLRHDQLRPRPLHRRGDPRGRMSRMTRDRAAADDRSARIRSCARGCRRCRRRRAQPRRARPDRARRALGRFELQLCRDCGTVQYPPREACRSCLSIELDWKAQIGVKRRADLARPPSRITATISFSASACPGGSDSCASTPARSWSRIFMPTCRAAPSRLRIARVSTAPDRRCSWRLPDKDDAEHGRRPPAARNDLRSEVPQGARHRRQDRGRPGDGESAAPRPAPTSSGSAIAEPWKKFAGLRRAAADSAGDAGAARRHRFQRSVRELAGEIGGKVDILVNNAEYHRSFGISGRYGVDTARAEMDVNYFGLLRLAQEFGPAMRARGADGLASAVAWVNLLSIYALANFPAHGTFSASKAAAQSLAQCLRAEMRPAGRARGQCLSRPDRRRVEPASSAAQARPRHARKRHRQGLARRRGGPLSGRRGAGMARALAR